ncbi:hypothetical protein [Paracoccus mutanolyticus]|uniref:hypothetical protein n=1 Tax=Paracoccus mutanolyticus TaxID=1499308 RepID=UPI0037C82DA5
MLGAIMAQIVPVVSAEHDTIGIEQAGRSSSRASSIGSRADLSRRSRLARAQLSRGRRDGDDASEAAMIATLADRRRMLLVHAPHEEAGG